MILVKLFQFVGQNFQTDLNKWRLSHHFLRLLACYCVSIHIRLFEFYLMPFGFHWLIVWSDYMICHYFTIVMIYHDALYDLRTIKTSLHLGRPHYKTSLNVSLVLHVVIVASWWGVVPGSFPWCQQWTHHTTPRKFWQARLFVGAL